MSEEKGNIEYIEILKDRQAKGLLSQIADKVTPINPTVKNEEPEDYETLVSSIFDDWTEFNAPFFFCEKVMFEEIVAFFGKNQKASLNLKTLF